MDSKKLIFLLALFSLTFFMYGCTQEEETSGGGGADTEEGTGDASGGNTPFSVVTAKQACSQLNEEEAVEDCLANVALDAQDESVCAEINEADLVVLFQQSYYVHEAEDPQKIDSDNDWMSDSSEEYYGTTTGDTDSDDDGLFDGQEPDEYTDPLNPDTDGDGISDGGEMTSYTYSTDPEDFPKDSDGDGMADDWETKYGLNPNDPSDASLDNDGDTIDNQYEYSFDTNPNSVDSDLDGYSDKEEIEKGSYPSTNLYTPLDADYDGDGYPDLHEEQVASGNRGLELANAKNTCYLILAINQNNKDLCAKSGWIGGSGFSVNAATTCVLIIDGLSDPAMHDQICSTYSNTLALARKSC